MLDRFAAIMVISIMVVSVMVFSGTGALAQSSEGEPSGAVAVGSLLPLTGDLAKFGEENYAASLLAVDDFNQYLEEKGAGWYLDVISEDSETRPTVALEKLQALHAKGVKIVLGPVTSSNLHNIKGYADSNQMLLVSCCSTSPSLAIEGDTTFRMSPDDSNQGTATAKLMIDAGIEVVVPVWRDDVWGTGLHETATESFTGRGGTADDGLSYNPEAAEFSSEASLLADAVQGYVDEYGADKVAVLYIGFGEVVSFMQSASSYDILHEVQWFGSDANTKDPSIVEDRIGLQFATDTSFTTVQVASGKNEKSARVDDSLLESLGRVPSTYASSSYDAVWLVGLSIEEAQSTEVADVAAVIPDVAASHSGALGSIALNAAGDLAQTNYDVWKIVDAEWILLGIYYSATDTVEREVAESAIEGAVAVGSLLPLTGDLAKHGEENYAAYSQAEMPGWIGGIFRVWADGLISDSELIAALEYLIDVGVIQTGLTDRIVELESHVGMLEQEKEALTKENEMLRSLQTGAEPVPMPEMENPTAPDGKQFMLDSINYERQNAGLDPVTLGHNTAAQAHADAMLQDCFSSHWGLDGLKPNMRYSLAGGYQRNFEQTFSPLYCSDSSAAVELADAVRDGMEYLMDRPNHRDDILDPRQAKVNIGLAFDGRHLMAVLVYEYGYVSFDRPPAIRDGMLSFSGRTDGVSFPSASDMQVVLLYDPPPQNLTVGQVVRTSCSSPGYPIAQFIPSHLVSFYGDGLDYAAERCPDPYDVSPDAVAPRSPGEAADIRNAIRNMEQVEVFVPFVPAVDWRAEGDEFEMTADMGPILEEHGAGVYEVGVIAFTDGDYVVISKHTVFYP